MSTKSLISKKLADKMRANMSIFDFDQKKNQMKTFIESKTINKKNISRSLDSVDEAKGLFSIESDGDDDGEDSSYELELYNY